ncbi:hypothetical protein PVK06_033528 [Gossypium arboreum]|uniref:Uncharacterized protein n=1 Tax=Gossypium arboreum TaxID=29729 RepID=A0ABR0NBP6_GOSAR|nr:hypothetical protein PVK06_033528 [Gossypium arboreum]
MAIIQTNNLKVIKILTDKEMEDLGILVLRRAKRLCDPKGSSGFGMCLEGITYLRTVWPNSV